MDTKTTKKSRKKLVIALIIAIIIALLAAAAVYVALRGGDAPVEDEQTGIVWDANAEEGGLVTKSQEEIQKELNEKVEQGMINISMNTSPVFADGTSEGNLMIVNSERNNYPQIVYIILKDTGEEIYRSGGIPVGSKIEYAALDVDLDAGSYECIAYFNNVDPDTGAFLGTAGAEITVIVEG